MAEEITCTCGVRVNVFALGAQIDDLTRERNEAIARAEQAQKELKEQRDESDRAWNYVRNQRDVNDSLHREIDSLRQRLKWSDGARIDIRKLLDDQRLRAERAERDLAAMQRRAESAESDWHEAEQTLAIIHAADQRAIQLWRAAHPGNELRMPSNEKLSVWLMEQLDQARKGADDATRA